ncbi:MAG TPA: antitoxin Xre/MbcA/ParS toxin-binding domain-containing protein [Acidobacteriota bacterium]|jgi:putative toxin-antitoxin system antitoxin component (TIGR02293 family)
MAQAAESEQLTNDVLEFQKLLRRGKPGANAYVVLLGLKTFDTPALLKIIQRGLSYGALERFQENVRLSHNEIIELIQIPARTLTRRKAQHRLQPDESDRLLRASRILGRALELFEGDVESARTWLSTPQTALGGASPLNIAKTELGSREVERLIGRLEHGVFS